MKPRRNPWGPLRPAYASGHPTRLYRVISFDNSGGVLKKGTIFLPMEEEDDGIRTWWSPIDDLAIELLGRRGWIRWPNGDNYILDADASFDPRSERGAWFIWDSKRHISEAHIEPVDLNWKPPPLHHRKRNSWGPLSPKIPGDPVKLDAFTRGFLEAVLWAGNACPDPALGFAEDASFEDIGWTPGNLPEYLRREAKRECEEFQRQYGSQIVQFEDDSGCSDMLAGHAAALRGMDSGSGFRDHVTKTNSASDNADALDDAARDHFGDWSEYLLNNLPPYPGAP